MDQQLKAIRLVTERYRELQGLRTALFGASLILVFGAVLSMAPRGNLWVMPLAVAALLALAIPGDRVLSRYYSSRFGRLVPQPGRTSGLMFVLIVVVLSVMNNAFGVGMLVSSLIPSSEKERRAVSQLQDNLEPVKEMASEVARDMGESLKPAAQEAAESVRATAREGVESVKQEGQASAQDVKYQAQDSKETVQQQRSG